MNHYRIFGGRLRTVLDLPDLDEAEPGPADWELRVVRGPAPIVRVIDAPGTAPVTDSVQVELLRHADGLRLVFDDTGVFDVADGGGVMTWYEEPAASREAVGLDVLGRVLPLALHTAGTLTLHGSSVRVGGAAIAFVGPKHHGKSTLALALARRGATLLSDDAVPVVEGDVPTTMPGVRRVRLWSDAAVRLGALDASDAALAGPGDKHLLPGGPADADAGSVPLEAVYLLAPPAGAPVRPARRVRVPAVEATVVLVSQMKLGPLLGGAEAGRVLRTCARLSAALPVFRLEVMRDFELLDELAATIEQWHAPARRAGAGAGAWTIPPATPAAPPPGGAP